MHPRLLSVTRGLVMVNYEYRINIDDAHALRIRLRDRRRVGRRGGAINRSLYEVILQPGILLRRL